MTHDPRKTDRRIQRTRQLLRDSLMALIIEKGYDSITVQNITDRANVARATFYLHFTDKDDLLFSGMRDIYEQLLQLYKTETFEEFINKAVHADFEHIMQYKDFYRIMISEKGSMAFLVRVRKFLADAIRETLLEPMVTYFDLEPTVPLEFIAQHAAGAQLGVIAWWLEHEPELTPQTVSTWSEVLLLGGLLTMMGISERHTMAENHQRP